jgi:hypothetical protein
MPPRFGAGIHVNNLWPNKEATKHRIEIGAGNLNDYYQAYSPKDLRIDIRGEQIEWLGEFSGQPTGYGSPTVIATIKAKRSDGTGVDTAAVQRIVDSLGKEPLWKFFARIRKRTNVLLKLANVEPEKNSGPFANIRMNLLNKLSW